MTTNPQKAAPCAPPEARSSDAGGLCCHIGHMDDLSRYFREELRGLIRRYRLWRTSREISEVRDFYLQADGEALRSYIRQVRILYRETRRDLQAMRRAENIRVRDFKPIVCEREEGGI